MNVAQLIERLKEMPQDAPVCHLWDGALRTSIEHVWLARGGSVATADFEQVCYDTEDRPEDAPTSEQDRYWESPPNPEAI
jgi:hypothetical protein